MTGSGSGVRFGVDVGEVRVGLAMSDPDGVLAMPVATLARDPSDAATDLARLQAHVAAQPTAYLVVGLPRTLAGHEGTAARRARAYAALVAARVDPVPVRLVDERLTTVGSHRLLRDSGVPGGEHRGVVDQAAAVLILQSALDAERATGRQPGELVRGGRKPRAKGRR